MYPKEQVLFARARAPDLGYVISIALVSLTKCLMSASLLPSPQFWDIVSKIEQTGWFPAICGEVSIFYEFELEKKAEITSK